ncbi:Chromodomain-helicase-DNA-binding protein 3 CHD-3 [Erwinia piriflorinigrans CFBP 5888]|uniref:Chromodomain-helicase-DNA-binding protein 3 CHD-3 n=2 Tax=Erwinia piriflorinigrans TaxID=665097 RepID=V5Z4Q4_9GAMM|nr:Chromodomain-helicase-DNA-binding protein 3 CHD-3 [Erwinia piriflorinigrans CFBP 5888]
MPGHARHCAVSGEREEKGMTIPPDSIVAHTLSRMQHNLEQRSNTGDVSQERSGLLFMGNVHDAFPRRLFLDTRLSPLDKTAWVMIRLYAQQHDGAIFPTYDELQVQLASAHSDKASRDTVSRVLLMLRLTGWISLCKRVRDDRGRVRGNIYAQHDEPLGFRDAETFDPGWLELVETSCMSKNKSIRMTALAVLNDILQEPGMRHRHSRLALIESRLSASSDSAEMARQRESRAQSLENGLGKKSINNSSAALSPIKRLGSSLKDKQAGKKSQKIAKSASYAGVRNPDGNVRSFTLSVNKKTYVPGANRSLLPDDFLNGLNSEDRQMLLNQMASLPDSVATALTGMLREQLTRRKLANPVGWMFAMLRRARNGELNLPEIAPDEASKRTGVPAAATPEAHRASASASPAVTLPANKASQEQVRAVIAAIRKQTL